MAASSSGSGGGGPIAGDFAAVCDSDGDCGEGSYCVRDVDDEALFTTFFFGVDEATIGGPAGGYCTRDCLDAGDCPGGVCITTGSRGLCAASCEYGQPTGAADDPQPTDKCHGRDDLMCAAVQDGVAVCMPICGGDEECGEERVCDRRLGICVDDTRPGLPHGSACEPDDAKTEMDEDECAGFCATFHDAFGEAIASACTARCSYGGDLTSTPNCGGIQEALCGFRPLVNGVAAGLGDVALCAGACMQHDACNYGSGMFCLDVGLVDEVGKGYCVPADECPNGDECANGEACVATVAGDYCLQGDSPDELIFELGEAGQPGSGAGGGGGTGGAGGGGTGGMGGSAGGAGGGGGS